MLSYRPIRLAHGTVTDDLELRPLRSTGITRLHDYCGPLRHPTQPSLTVTGVWLMVTRHHCWGFPCFGRSPLPRMLSPLPRRNRWMLSLSRPTATAFPKKEEGRLPQHPFSRPAQRSLTLRPAWSLKSPKVPRYQSTSTHSLPLAPLWLLPAERPIGRVGFAPTGDRRLSRHTPLMGQRRLLAIGPALCPILRDNLHGIWVTRTSGENSSSSAAVVLCLNVRTRLQQ